MSLTHIYHTGVGIMSWNRHKIGCPGQEEIFSLTKPKPGAFLDDLFKSLIHTSNLAGANT